MQSYHLKAEEKKECAVRSLVTCFNSLSSLLHLKCCKVYRSRDGKKENEKLSRFYGHRFRFEPYIYLLCMRAMTTIIDLMQFFSISAHTYYIQHCCYYCESSYEHTQEKVYDNCTINAVLCLIICKNVCESNKIFQIFFKKKHYLKVWHVRLICVGVPVHCTDFLYSSHLCHPFLRSTHTHSIAKENLKNYID